MEEKTLEIASVAVNPKRPNPGRGSSRYSSGAAFAQEFRAWWDGQRVFARHADLAAEIDVGPVTLRFWLAGRGFPRNAQCEKLYSMTQLDCFGPGKDAARAAHERLIPREVKKERVDAFRALIPEERAKRGKAARARRHKFVSDAELSECHADPRKAKTIRGPKFIVCLECGQIGRDLSGHLGIHGMTKAQYKEKFGLNRGTSLRSLESGEKQAASMKSSKHRPPSRSREYLAQAIEASREAHAPGRARLEEQLNRRGKRLGARPRRWKRTRGGDVVRDARIARLRLSGLSLEEIAASAGLSLTAAFFRLKRMSFPHRARVFAHGKPVMASDIVALCSDFNLRKEKAGELLRIGYRWMGRLLAGNTARPLGAPLAKRLLKIRRELTTEMRKRAAAGKQGGRPRQLLPSEKSAMGERYDALRGDLKSMRAWIQEQEKAPSFSAVWNWLCERFRLGQLRSLQFCPQFFDWIEKNYDARAFFEGKWTPHELAVQFLADDYGASEDTIRYNLSHRPKQLRSSSATVLPIL
jgi:hypothetical protein